jgi:serine/threonine protein phosphatase 1
MERVIVIGDIHGCYWELMDLLDRIGPTARDKLVSVGDLITKGPGNRQVLEFFQAKRNRRAVIGNHERILLQRYRGEKVKLKPAHKQAIKELGRRFPDHMEWVARLPGYIDLGRYVVVHAGVRPGISLEKQSIRDLTEIRALEGGRKGTPWFERYEGKKKVIFGHWVFSSPLVKKKTIGIDTGCVYGGELTALVLPERKLVSVPAHRPYARKE